MKRFKSILANAVFVIQLLIIFILVFESRVAVPPLLQAFGRLHPMLLHLPIGLLLVTVILLYARRFFEGKAMDELVSLLLHTTAITASLTTLMGMFLSLEGTFGEDQLRLHKWMGVALSFLCWALLGIGSNARVLKPLGLAGVVLLIFTGHYGAMLTHGENFVFAPLMEAPPRVARVITDSTPVFSATIEPILESKCYGCHNERKAKGDLILTSLASINAGGETGPLWHPNDAANSLIIERLLLPIEHDDHMPPKDKAQLTEDEISFISLWIDRGADTTAPLGELSDDDTLARLASVIIPRYQEATRSSPQYTFEFASPERISELSIPNRTVFQIARNEPAIQAEFYLKESYDRKYLEELNTVKQQLVSLNLSRMPVTDADLKTVGNFINLESLNLNNTDIKGTALNVLASLPKLTSLSLSGTGVSADALRALGKSSSLEEVFIWNTRVSTEECARLTAAFPHINWHIGYIPDETEILKLNAPAKKNKGEVLKGADRLALRHNLPGTVIRYTLDGSEPDSLSSPVYKDPIGVDNLAFVKARAYKDGWLSSDVVEFFVFRQGYEPDSAVLLTAPHERFQGEGARTLFDGLKGLPNFYRHPAWMAFRENDLEMQFSFESKPPVIRHITLSFAHNNRASYLPPAEMELWGGNAPGDLTLIGSQRFPKGEKPGKARIEGVTMEVKESNFRYYKLVARPRRQHARRNPKKELAWLMVDEIFIQ